MTHQPLLVDEVMHWRLPRTPKPPASLPQATPCSPAASRLYSSSRPHLPPRICKRVWRPCGIYRGTARQRQLGAQLASQRHRRFGSRRCRVPSFNTSILSPSRASAFERGTHPMRRIYCFWSSRLLFKLAALPWLFGAESWWASLLAAHVNSTRPSEPRTRTPRPILSSKQCGVLNSQKVSLGMVFV